MTDENNGRPSGGRNASSSLRRALDILDIVSNSPHQGRGLSLGDLSERLDVHKSTVLRLTAPLVDSHLLERDTETGGFRLGYGALQLGQSYLQHTDLRSIARPELRTLMRRTSCTCHLVILSGSDVVYLDKVEDEAVVRMASRIGATMPAFCTAVGKAMLAFSPPETVDPILDGPLVPLTSMTETDPGALRKQFASIRQQGYSVDDRENEPEVRCVAAPIFGAGGRVAGALSISSLASRMSVAKVREIGPDLVQAGLRISQRLGYIPGTDGVQAAT